MASELTKTPVVAVIDLASGGTLAHHGLATADSYWMTSAAFGRKVGLVAFVALSLIATAVGWVLFQFDDQYESSSVAERVLVGVFGGALGALIVSPLSAVASAITGVGAARFHRKRTPPCD